LVELMKMSRPDIDSVSDAAVDAPLKEIEIDLNNCVIKKLLIISTSEIAHNHRGSRRSDTAQHSP